MAVRLDRAGDLDAWREEFEREAPLGAASEYQHESDELIAIADDVRRLVSRISKLQAAAEQKNLRDELPILPEIIGESLQAVLTPSAGRVLAAALSSAS
jgi:hypothetical protein